MKIFPVLAIVGVFISSGCGRDRTSILSSLPIPRNISGAVPDTETATVEKVFIVKDGEYSGIHYLITWHGQEAIVDDPIHSTNYKVGDKIGFLIMRHDMSDTKDPNGPKLIGFHAMPFILAPRP